MIAGSIGWLHGNDPLGDSPVEAALATRDIARDRLNAGHAAHPRIVDPLHWGGYLAYAWMGDPRYFIDGRDHLVLFGNGAFDDNGHLWQGMPDALEILDVYEAGVVLWVRGAPLDRILRSAPGWRLVHEDAIAVVYERME
jgi:hypothetical protein